MTSFEITGLTDAHRLDGSDSSKSLLTGSGEMAERLRAFDWGQTPIGPVDTWSPTLQTIVGLLVANRLPLLLWWGPDYISIYNDAYRSVLGTKHPWALGKPCREVFPEAWHILKPLIDTPFTGGPATWMEDFMLELYRHGFVEEAHFTIAYSPVPDGTAPRGIGGVLAMGYEITEKVVSERRVEALRDLATRAGEAKTAEDAASRALEALRAYVVDVPFAALYLLDERLETARLSATTGVEPADPAAPLVLPADPNGETGHPWPIAEVRRSGSLTIVEGLAECLQKVPAGPWSDPPHTAVVVPLRSNTALGLAGIFVAGVSPRLKLDKQYYSFFELLGSQLASIIATARAYEEERKRAEALAEIDRAKTLFFSNVSHEFRTPLTLMIGPIEDSLACELPKEQRDRLEVAHRNSLRLLKLVNSLLDFSRIEAGRAQASCEAVDLSAFTAELASSFRSAIERAGLSLVVDCATLPEPVYVDPDLWEKIVLNLLSNAFKFTFEGQISVRLAAAGGSALLLIEDTGVGIPESELPRLFERFHRIEGQKSRTHEGSGIGLALVQELVKLHHGTIRVESKPGRGTTFAISIPFGRAHLPASRLGTERSLGPTSVRADAYVQEALRWLPDAPQSDDRPSADVTLLNENPHVLIADDNADMRAYLCRLLGPSCDVEAVGHGEAALEAIQRRRPDLLITDVMMPGLHGLGLVHSIRNDPGLRELPVIMLSARAGEEARIEGLEAGADDYLVKPFSARVLIAKVLANLKLARVRQEGTKLLRDSERRFRELIDALPAAVYTTDVEGYVTYFNQAAVDLAGRRPIPGVDRWCVTWKLLRSDGTPLPHDECPMAIAIKESRPVRNEEVVALRPDGTRVSFIAHTPLLHDHAGTLIGAVNVLLDITDRKRVEDLLRRNEGWLSGQKEAFQSAMNGAPLATSLGILIRTAIAQAGDGRRCAFYIAGDNGAMQHVVGMPDSYARAITGYNGIGPDSIASGLAIHTGKPVITPDVRNDPKWKPRLAIVEEYGYRAHWSFPVETVAGKIVGAFAMYLNEPGDVTPYDMEFVTKLTQAAAIIISRHREAVERERVDRVRAEAEVALRRSETQLRAYFAASFDVVYWMSADWMVLRRLEGKTFIRDATEPNAKWIDDYLHPDDQADVMASVTDAIRTKSVFELEHRVRRADGTFGWCLSRATPLLDEKGEIVEWIGTAADVTARRRYNERQSLLLNELNHRVKNTLATVQSIAMQTLRDAPTKTEGWQALQARILALAAAHDVLTKGHWEGADIYEVIQGSLAAYRPNGQERRLKLTGPNIRLLPRAALTLSLALHELATNAGKYGALSINSGRVDVDWSITAEPPAFSLRWAESGGPPVKVPRRRGFGSRLIERGLAHDLDGDIRLEFEPSGVICTIAAPIEGVIKGLDGPSAIKG